MVIVSDTSPIINLAIIGHLDLLPKIFGTIYIPTAVYDEISVGGKGKPGAYEVEIADWVVVANCKDKDFVNTLSHSLDIGESEAIALAVELGTKSIILDEKRGRETALSFDLKPVGILGILILAKKRGLIVSVENCMIALREQAGFFIASPLFQQILVLADE